MIYDVVFVLYQRRTASPPRMAPVEEEGPWSGAVVNEGRAQVHRLVASDAAQWSGDVSVRPCPRGAISGLRAVPLPPLQQV